MELCLFHDEFRTQRPCVSGYKKECSDETSVLVSSVLLQRSLHSVRFEWYWHF